MDCSHIKFLKPGDQFEETLVGHVVPGEDFIDLTHENTRFVTRFVRLSPSEDEPGDYREAVVLESDTIVRGSRFLVPAAARCLRIRKKG